MTPLPDGYPDQSESPRQVLVVEDDQGRSQRLCALLTRHGLRANAVPSAKLAKNVARNTTRGRGVVLIGSQRAGATGRELAERIRAVDAGVPMILVGGGADASGPSPTTHASLPPEVSDEHLVQEVERRLSTAPSATPATPPGTILLVDDDPRLRKILQAFLELKGFTVSAVESGEAALEHVTRAVPRAVLLDIKMPGLNGIQTLKAIRSDHPNLPVIFLTHVDEEHLKEEAEHLGAYDYLVKPFNFDHLETILLTKLPP